MQINLEILMQAILADPDAAMESGWSPRHWESVGFATLARRRIREVRDLKMVLACLGASATLQDLKDLPNDALVDLIEEPFSLQSDSFC